jgi:excisionase family DNA binding protein
MKAHLQVIFTLDELAAYLKVGKRTLYRLAAHGEIPAFKVGGRGGFVKVKSISASMIRPEPEQRRR